MPERQVDILIIGGGINGCGIARDAAGRGYSVLLVEMDDLASGTSSWSSKLIHGGLRYLERLHFRLVRESLAERELLWSMAPHIIRPMRFVLPCRRSLRPAWLLRLGLFFYDHLGARHHLAPTCSLDMKRDEAAQILKPLFHKAFEYSDLTVDDSRLVILNAQDAADRGAMIKTRTSFTSASRQTNGFWHVELRDLRRNEDEKIKARIIINAAGPWVDSILRRGLSGSSAAQVRLVQGSHIVIRKRYDDTRAYVLQHVDKRIIFAIPYEDDFTLIGTTDQDYSGDPGDAKITEKDIDYLCSAMNAYFSTPICRSDIVWQYSGVRPLYDDGASCARETTREYVIQSYGAKGEPGIVNVLGGKLTTYRRLAEVVLATVGLMLGHRKEAWTAGVAFPAGNFFAEGYEGLEKRMRDCYPFLRANHLRRLLRLYGNDVNRVLGAASSYHDLGQDFGLDLTQAEIVYLMDREWALTVDDVLWRRTKLGLRMQEGLIDKEALGSFMASNS